MVRDIGQHNTVDIGQGDSALSCALAAIGAIGGMTAAAFRFDRNGCAYLVDAAPKRGIRGRQAIAHMARAHAATDLKKYVQENRHNGEIPNSTIFSKSTQH